MKVALDFLLELRWLVGLHHLLVLVHLDHRRVDAQQLCLRPTGVLVVLELVVHFLLHLVPCIVDELYSHFLELDDRLQFHSEQIGIV